MLYVHVPFCRSFCIYCDFYSETQAGRDTGAYVREVCREMETRREEIALTDDVGTIYIGGGTPSALPLPFLCRIISTARQVASCREELTVEVNPDDITSEYAAGLKEAGVSRISMGVQSLDDGMLGWMRRRHDAAGARRAFAALRAAGFDNISLDIIFGIGGLTSAMLDSTVDGIIALSPEHVSAYQLSVEPGSALCALAENGSYRELSEDECAGQYALICRKLSEAGYEHYEISNWAKPGFRSRHNSAYWTRAPYVGVGPGAHSLSIGDAEQRRSWNSRTLPVWGEEGFEILTPEQVREEEIMLSLRTSEGYRGRRIPEDRWFVSDDIITDCF